MGEKLKSQQGFCSWKTNYRTIWHSVNGIGYVNRLVFCAVCPPPSNTLNFDKRLFYEQKLTVSMKKQTVKILLNTSYGIWHILISCNIPGWHELADFRGAESNLLALSKSMDLQIFATETFFYDCGKNVIFCRYYAGSVSCQTYNQFNTTLNCNKT